MFIETEMEAPEITARKVRISKRLETLPRHFGRNFLAVERSIFGTMRSVCPDYDGGYWEFWELSNGGFFMALPKSETYDLTIYANDFTGQLDGCSAGIVACLFVYSTLSFEPGMVRMADYFHWLRDYAAGLPTSETILAAID
jgi:hypothetical protein